MSASSKKKLRKEQEAAKLTEKQLTAQKETKKTNLYTALFVAVMVILLVVAITIGVKQIITSSGIREKNTTALTVGEHELSNAELNYFFVDSVNNFLSQYGSYAAMFGLDTSKPLDEQYVDEEQTTTWADNFLDSAKENAKAVYAVNDAAKAEGFTLSEEEQLSITSTITNLRSYAMIYGFSDADDYLKAVYGNGSSVESYEAYLQRNTIYTAYQERYADSLTYDEAALKAADSENYTSYNYNTYYVAASRFLEGGTTAEDGTTTYSDEEKAASVTAAEEAAKSLAGEGSTTVEALDAAIAALTINSESASAASTAHEGTLYTSISTVYSDWLADSSRKEGDVAYFASESTSTDEDGNEVVTTNGYTVVCYLGTEDNSFALKNVRHILIPFLGGTTDSSTGVTTYSDEEKATAKEEAEEVLATWKAGEATEESFAALVQEHSTDSGSIDNGGLYEDIYPGQMVANFNDWCFDADRKAGDTGIVESTYGYHVMYFVGNSDMTYRNYLIQQDLLSDDMDEWYNALLESVTVTEGSTKYINTSLVLG